MPLAIISLISTMLPVILKLVMWVIEKRSDNEELKKQFLIFLSNIEKDVSVKLHDRYSDQIERLKKQIEDDK